jgi:AcrR family transcriptional regulator
MATSLPSYQNPRKRPSQARAAATVDAIFEATIQLLLADGMDRLTTTRVAERAGVSVGTLYQYFPHKQALIYALNQRYLDIVAQRIEASCEASRGKPIREMVETLVTTYWLAKTEHADVTRVLYRSAVELDTEALVEAFAGRVDRATIAMFETAPDLAIEDLASVNLALLTTIFGTVRGIFERNLPVEVSDAMYRQLVAMCVAYVDAAERSAAA